MGKEKSDGIKQNIIYSIGYQILILVIPLITAPYTSRVLGADNTGIYSYTQAFANYFVLFAMLGVSNYGNRSIARVRDEKKELSRVFWEIFDFQLLMTGVMSVLYLGYVFTAVKSNRMIYLLQFLYVISAAFDISWFFFGIEKFKITVTRNAVIKILNAMAVFVFVKEKTDLPIYTFIMAVSILLNQLVIWPFLPKYVEFTKVTWKGIVRHIKPNLVLFIPVIAISLYNIMDKLMLGYFSTEAEVGFYSNAEKIAQIPNSIILAIGTVLMPRISNLIATGQEEKGNELFEKSFRVILLSSTLFAFGLGCVAKTFAPWFYGQEFEKCGIYILWLCPTILFKSAAGAIRTQVIIPKGKDNVYIISVIAGAVVNVIANILLIPVYEGLGAVIGTVFAEGAVCLIQIIMTRKDVNYGNFKGDFIVYMVAGVIMGLAIMQIDFVNGLLQMAIKAVAGGIIYIMLVALYYAILRKRGRNNVEA